MSSDSYKSVRYAGSQNKWPAFEQELEGAVYMVTYASGQCMAIGWGTWACRAGVDRET